MSSHSEHGAMTVRRRVSVHPKTVTEQSTKRGSKRRTSVKSKSGKVQRIAVDQRVWKEAVKCCKKRGFPASHIQVLGPEEVVVLNHSAR